ncbi:hypothetical protein [Streptomyces flaveus]|uniref:Uncharacterized protein n=1 Tax=Streptomyces flaveus TaxID=66370 RepID=A0A917VG53_9ACTN|nr:hypothetical protein [Streptomyces flaveus]GGK73296.1 hypothetical protein GCM10010094_37970 [Streptomyces flaveus]
MNQKQLPEQALLEIRPELLRRYLTAQGWFLVQEQPRAEVWATDLPDGRMEVLLPKDSRLVDFVRRLRDLFDTVAVVEDREPASVLHAIGAAQTDVHSVRLQPEGLPSGTVWLAEGSRAVASLRDLFISATYRATTWLAHQQPRPVEPGRKSNQVYDFLSRRVLLGLTRPGSYILTAEIPLNARAPEQLSIDAQGRYGGIPLARRVSEAFYEGAAAAHTAAQHASVHDGDLSAFADQAGEGLSANVCEALAGLSSNGKIPFVLQTEWASALPLDRPAGLLEFRPELITQLQRGADYLREHFGRQGVSLRGIITKMERDTTTGPGRVILLGRPDDQPASRAMRVYIEVSAADYDRLGRAHLDGQEVVVQGDLERIGNRWHLVRVQSSTVEEIRD